MFSVEFRNSKVLQWALSILLFNYFITFYDWVRLSIADDPIGTEYSQICPPYFQNCESLHFLHALPFGYSQTFLYMVFFGGFLWVVHLLSEKKWKEAQLVIIPFFFWHFFNTFFYSGILSGNFEYYVVGYGVILLFFPHKEFFLKLFLVALYSLSVVSKVHPAWIEGAYFTNLVTGLPIFQEWSVPLLSNLVMFFELVGSWCLLSSNKLLRRFVLLFFILFHLYSGILVEYRYPATVLPMLLILFGPWYRHQKVPLDKKSMFGWLFIALLVFFQFSPKLIEGDEKLTLEGNNYGLYMFESNHQCILQITYHFVEGSKNEVYVSNTARHRCSPYSIWYKLNKVCKDVTEIQSISWTFDHSINGNPFLRIVDEENVCNLEYKAFSHNEWIKTENDNPEVIGWPVKNLYY